MTTAGGDEAWLRRMISPDRDSAIARLQEMVHEAGIIVPFTGAGISTECGIPDFRSPGGLWTRYRPIPFDEFLASQEARNESWRRRFAMEEQFGGAKPGRGHRALASLYRVRQGAGRHHAKHRQFASSLGNCAGTRRRIARQYDLRLVPRLQRALRTVVGAPANGRRERLRAGLSGLRRLHQDRDRLVRSGDAGCRNAARPGSCSVLRSVPGDRLVARGLAGRRLSLDGETQWRAARHRQSRTDRVRRDRRPLVAHRTSGPCSNPSSSTEWDISTLCTGRDAFGQCCIFALSRRIAGVIFDSRDS